MKQLLIYMTGCIILLVNANKCIAQEETICPSGISQQEMNIIRATAIQRHENIKKWKGNGGMYKPQMQLLTMPAQIHILIKKTGEGDNTKYCGLTQSKLVAAIDTVNKYFTANNAGIQLVMCGPVNYIYDNNFYDCSEEDFKTLKQMYNVKNVLNIYFTGTVATYAGFGSAGGIVVMKDVVKSTTLTHEIGHYLSLAHTHGSGEGTCSMSDEFVDGSNCDTGGDGFCDTPADPNLNYSCKSEQVNNKTCIYIGTAKDAHGDSYDPLTNNIMSYSPQNCRTSFTEEQIWQMRYSLEQKMLFCCSDKSPGYLILNQPVSGINHFDAKDSIKAYNAVASGSIINYTAGEKIRLTNGMLAKKGCHLKIALSACTKFPDVPNPVNCYINNLIEETVPEDKMTVNNIAKKDKNSITAYPNPFSSQVMFTYQNKEQDHIFLAVYDLQGRKIAVLLDNVLTKPGKHQLKWNTEKIKNGYYLYRMQIGSTNFISGKIIKAGISN
ncbi:MAG: T9SS type A sorting domain-containing protein [Chitinophagaceae bacterium]|nr:T9SS type A sorting domain-containing protein [Chitinophagaceae bacterium]